MSFDFLRKTFLGATLEECARAAQYDSNIDYLILNRDLFIHPLSSNLRSNRKRNVDNQGSTFVLTILTTISKTM